MRLLLVRHAESVGNVEGRMQGREETDLSEAGREQARRLHDRLVGEGLQPTCVLSSPQRRTAQTAEIVCRSWSVPIELWDELVEHDVGVLTGRKWEEIEAEYPVMGRELRRTGNWDLVQGAERMRDRRARGERIVRAPSPSPRRVGRGPRLHPRRDLAARPLGASGLYQDVGRFREEHIPLRFLPGLGALGGGGRRLAQPLLVAHRALQRRLAPAGAPAMTRRIASTSPKPGSRSDG